MHEGSASSKRISLGSAFENVCPQTLTPLTLLPSHPSLPRCLVPTIHTGMHECHTLRRSRFSRHSQLDDAQTTCSRLCPSGTCLKAEPELRRSTLNTALKLQAIADAGFKSVEMGFPDLQQYAKQKLGDLYQPLSDDDGSGDLESLREIARDVRVLLDSLGLEVLCLQPFSQFEGYTGRQAHQREARFKKAKAWMEIMQVLRCDMLQVGSTDDRASTQDRDVIVRDLQDLADLANGKNMRIAYEVGLRGQRISAVSTLRIPCSPLMMMTTMMMGNARCGAGRPTMIHGAISGRSAKRVSE